MNKREIVSKLKVDLEYVTTLLRNDFVSDESKLRLEGIEGYLKDMIELIEEGIKYEMPVL